MTPPPIPTLLLGILGGLKVFYSQNTHLFFNSVNWHENFFIMVYRLMGNSALSYIGETTVLLEL